MASSLEGLEKKLDRYYNDLMEKIVEILESHKNILGEQKDLKKDLAKLKEHVLDIKKEAEAIDLKLSSRSASASFAEGKQQTGNTKIVIPASSSSGSSGGNLAVNAVPSNAGLAKKAPPPSLKDFLAQQAAIYDVKVLNAFIKSAKEIIKTNARIEPAFIKPVVDYTSTLPIVIAGKMKLSRDNGSGSMALCLEQESADAIVRAVFMLATDAAVSAADIKDVTSEICNQICGKSKLALKNEGYSFEIEMPEIQQGTAVELNALLGYPKIILIFDYEKKPFYIYFWG